MLNKMSEVEKGDAGVSIEEVKVENKMKKKHKDVEGIL